LENRLLIVTFVVLAVLLVSGCCCCANYVPSGPAPTWDFNDDVGGGSSLVGAWGDPGVTGSIVDAGGNFVGDAYGAEAYRFNADGTYLYRIIGSGLVITGMVEVRGQYRIDGDRLELYNNKDSWYPALGESRPGYKNKASDDLSYEFQLEDDDSTLVLIDEYGNKNYYNRINIEDT
jgi:hypothetical protein